MSAAMDEYHRQWDRWFADFCATISAPRKAAVDPRDADHSRPGIFAYHNCWKCRSGELPCVRGEPRRCEFPHARND